MHGLHNGEFVLAVLRGRADSRGLHQTQFGVSPVRRRNGSIDVANRDLSLDLFGVEYGCRMTLSKQTLQADLTAAMKAREVEVTGSLRMLLAAVGNAEVAGKEQVVLTEDQIIAVVRAEVKKRNDASVLYAQGGREELAKKEQSEVAILSRYLPAEMSDDDLNSVVASCVAAAAADGHSGPRAMGSVMKLLKEKVGSDVDGGRLAAAVKGALA
jgi:uncharacterized protein